MKDRGIFLVKSMADTFSKLRITRAAAALSYYLTMTIFPFLICAAVILGNLNICESDLFEFLADVIPSEVMSVITEFFSNASGNQTELMLFIGITAMLTSSSAAFRSFVGTMGEIQGKMRFTGIWGAVFSFMFSIVFLIAVYASGIVILSGEWLMQMLQININIFEMWSWMRFVALFLLLFGIIYSMYIISAPKETKKTHRLPGALVGSAAIVITSIVYSRMISASIRHTVLYGSLASVIIMMIWLYTCGIILIMGNVFNISLRNMYEEFGS